jgi:hypothetical protein
MNGEEGERERRRRRGDVVTPALVVGCRAVANFAKLRPRDYSDRLPDAALCLHWLRDLL